MVFSNIGILPISNMKNLDKQRKMSLMGFKTLDFDHKGMHQQDSRMSSSKLFEKSKMSRKL